MTKAFEAGNKARNSAGNGLQSVTISFAEHYASSDQFDAIFKEGMALVEQTASYLDGPGRRDSKVLSANISVTYATESMRLTTRLLELASWLLIRRALKDGDITEQEARAKRQRMKLESIGRPSHVKTFNELPEALRSLIRASFLLQDRIIKLDRVFEDVAVGGDVPEACAANPVGAQMRQLTAAFGK